MKISRLATIAGSAVLTVAASLALAGPALADDNASTHDVYVHLPRGAHLPVPPGSIPVGASTIHYQPSDIGRDIVRVEAFPGLDYSRFVVIGASQFTAYGEPFATETECFDLGNFLVNQKEETNFLCQWQPGGFQLFVE
ncbi:hypothetical protein HQ346_04585 [Rhodococcus sp. BP-252]|uniref:Uncharacterized protein n=1 Tax=Rhodococcoides kyotonense TaxID=398843 RepID=A0A177YJH3_9NOCA|nr:MULTISPECIES: hypothetical protein [Rhodococcus]MBY6410684.1 hypothetical protein [Rhodococcus sp. BP-320]MBY6415491.1 hypothetical protein [Rhodococcus sp. BP-321]MBY6420106.1 hypothetical protein [Rhodococcus sp. BP-324]MBY6425240.1 hypothetical protein [Rhodococcus sp. BP-323]MBY6430697.1 hypothetical protein [Rhodococcus sp. BP-322]